MPRLLSILIALAALAAAAPSAPPRADAPAPPSPVSRILAGVRQVAAPGVPGSLAVTGAEAAPLLAGKAGKETQAAVAAAGRLEKGRIVALGHDGYFREEALGVADTVVFLKNAVLWAAGREDAKVGVVGARALAAALAKAGVDAREVKLSDPLAGYHALAVTHAGLGEGDLARLREYARSGGGVLAASTGWGWSQITGKPVAEHPLNRAFQGSGLAWTGGMLERTGPGGFEVRPIPALTHAGEALAALLQRRRLSPAETAQAVSSCLLAARSLPSEDTTFLPRLRELRQAAGAALIPTEKTPVTLREPLSRLALALDTEELQRAPVEAVRAHPAAADFPGAVAPEVSRVAARVRVDPRGKGWQSLGFYAPPGSAVRITAPGLKPSSGVRVRIGAHTDELWHLDAWKRAPSVSRSFPLAGESTEVASAFGGLVYVEMPQRAPEELRMLVVRDVVPAPYFRLGETSPEAWRATIRSYPAPWAELAGERVILTVPSALVRELGDPTPLMKLWDAVVEAEERLIGMPRRDRPERIVADRQISAGYMHSGYPIMVPIDDSARLALDEPRLRREGSWGHFHELGHNLQSPDWTFEGTGEVTNNVLAMYVYAGVLGLPFDSGHPAIRKREERTERVKRHLAAGAPFERWKADPFLALTMYIQVIEAFGWEPFEKVFAEYRSLPAAERPKNDGEKRDQWLMRLSRAVGRNLGPFFLAWGVPTSETAREAVKALPAWSPEELRKP